jgi:hypothetical protein
VCACLVEHESKVRETDIESVTIILLQNRDLMLPICFLETDLATKKIEGRRNGITDVSFGFCFITFLYI